MADTKTVTKPATESKPTPVPGFGSNQWFKDVKAAADKIASNTTTTTTTGSNVSVTSTGTGITSPTRPSDAIAEDGVSIRGFMEQFEKDRQAARDAVNKEYEEREKKAGGTAAYIDATLSADGRWNLAQRKASSVFRL